VHCFIISYLFIWQRRRHFYCRRVWHLPLPKRIKLPKIKQRPRRVKASEYRAQHLPRLLPDSKPVSRPTPTPHLVLVVAVVKLVWIKTVTESSCMRIVVNPTMPALRWLKHPCVFYSLVIRPFVFVSFRT